MIHKNNLEIETQCDLLDQFTDMLREHDLTTTTDDKQFLAENGSQTKAQYKVRVESQPISNNNSRMIEYQYRTISALDAQNYYSQKQQQSQTQQKQLQNVTTRQTQHQQNFTNSAGYSPQHYMTLPSPMMAAPVSSQVVQGKVQGQQRQFQQQAGEIMVSLQPSQLNLNLPLPGKNKSTQHKLRLKSKEPCQRQLLRDKSLKKGSLYRECLQNVTKGSQHILPPARSPFPKTQTAKKILAQIPLFDKMLLSNTPEDQFKLGLLNASNKNSSPKNENQTVFHRNKLSILNKNNLTTQISPNNSDLTHYLNEEMQKQQLRSNSMLNRKESPIKVETLYKEQKKREHDEIKKQQNLEKMRAKSELRKTYLPFSRNAAVFGGGKRRSSLLGGINHNRQVESQRGEEGGYGASQNHLLGGGQFMTQTVNGGQNSARLVILGSQTTSQKGANSQGQDQSNQKTNSLRPTIATLDHQQSKLHLYKQPLLNETSRRHFIDRDLTAANTTRSNLRTILIEPQLPFQSAKSFFKSDILKGGPIKGGGSLQQQAHPNDNINQTMTNFNESPSKFKQIQLPSLLLDLDDSKRHTMVDLRNQITNKKRLTSTFQRTKSILGGQQIETHGTVAPKKEEGLASNHNRQESSSHNGKHFNLEEEDFNNTLQQNQLQLVQQSQQRAQKQFVGQASPNQKLFKNMDTTFDRHFRQTNTFKSPINHIDEQFTSNMNSPMNLTASNYFRAGQRTNSISLLDTTGTGMGMVGGARQGVKNGNKTLGMGGLGKQSLRQKSVTNMSARKSPRNNKQWHPVPLNQVKVNIMQTIEKHKEEQLKLQQYKQTRAGRFGSSQQSRKNEDEFAKTFSVMGQESNYQVNSLGINFNEQSEQRSTFRTFKEKISSSQPHIEIENHNQNQRLAQNQQLKNQSFVKHKDLLQVAVGRPKNDVQFATVRSETPIGLTNRFSGISGTKFGSIGALKQIHKSIILSNQSPKGDKAKKQRKERVKKGAKNSQKSQKSSIDKKSSKQPSQLSQNKNVKKHTSSNNSFDGRTKHFLIKYENQKKQIESLQSVVEASSSNNQKQLQQREQNESSPTTTQFVGSATDLQAGYSPHAAASAHFSKKMSSQEVIVHAHQQSIQKEMEIRIAKRKSSQEMMNIDGSESVVALAPPHAGVYQNLKRSSLFGADGGQSPYMQKQSTKRDVNKATFEEFRRHLSINNLEKDRVEGGKSTNLFDNLRKKAQGENEPAKVELELSDSSSDDMEEKKVKKFDDLNMKISKNKQFYRNESLPLTSTLKQALNQQTILEHNSNYNYIFSKEPSRQNNLHPESSVSDSDTNSRKHKIDPKVLTNKDEQPKLVSEKFKSNSGSNLEDLQKDVNKKSQDGKRLTISKNFIQHGIEQMSRASSRHSIASKFKEREMISECASFDPEKVFGREDGQSSTDILTTSSSQDSEAIGKDNESIADRDKKLLLANQDLIPVPSELIQNKEDLGKGRVKKLQRLLQRQYLLNIECVSQFWNFCNELVTNTKLKQISKEDTEYNYEIPRAALILQQMTKGKLILINSRLEDQWQTFCQKLSQVVEQNVYKTPFKVIYLCNCKISDDQIANLLFEFCIASNYKVEEIIMERQAIGNKTCKALSDILRKSFQPVHISVSEPKNDFNYSKVLTQRLNWLHLDTNETLQSLSLPHCGLKDEQLQLISQYFNKFCHIDISFNNFSSFRLWELIMNTPQKLLKEQERIQNPTGKQKMVKERSMQLSLNIAGCFLGESFLDLNQLPSPKQITALRDLFMCPQIKHVDLSYTYADPRVIRSSLLAIPEAPSLQSLHVSVIDYAEFNTFIKKEMPHILYRVFKSDKNDEDKGKAAETQQKEEESKDQQNINQNLNETNLKNKIKIEKKLANMLQDGSKNSKERWIKEVQEKVATDIFGKNQQLVFKRSQKEANKDQTGCKDWMKAEKEMIFDRIVGKPEILNRYRGQITNLRLPSQTLGFVENEEAYKQEKKDVVWSIGHTCWICSRQSLFVTLVSMREIQGAIDEEPFRNYKRLSKLTDKQKEQFFDQLAKNRNPVQELDLRTPYILSKATDYKPLELLLAAPYLRLFDDHQSKYLFDGEAFDSYRTEWHNVLQHGKDKSKAQWKHFGYDAFTDRDPRFKFNEFDTVWAIGLLSDPGPQTSFILYRPNEKETFVGRIKVEIPVRSWATHDCLITSKQEQANLSIERQEFFNQKKFSKQAKNSETGDKKSLDLVSETDNAEKNSFKSSHLGGDDDISPKAAATNSSNKPELQKKQSQRFTVLKRLKRFSN